MLWRVPEDLIYLHKGECSCLAVTMITSGTSPLFGRDNDVDRASCRAEYQSKFDLQDWQRLLRCLKAFLDGLNDQIGIAPPPIFL